MGVHVYLHAMVAKLVEDLPCGFLIAGPEDNRPITLQKPDSNARTGKQEPRPTTEFRPRHLRPGGRDSGHSAERKNQEFYER